MIAEGTNLLAHVSTENVVRIYRKIKRWGQQYRLQETKIIGR